MPAADVCRRLIYALNDRDWDALARLLGGWTAVEDHRELAFQGDGATLVRVWRSAFESRPSGAADVDVLDATADRALVRLAIGDDEGRLTVHAVVAVADGRVTRFDAYERGPSGESAARAAFRDG